MTRQFPGSLNRLLRVVVATILVSASDAHAQQGISEGSLRPFVTGIIPVVGGQGGVGGVAIDAQGAVSEADLSGVAALRDAWQTALAGAPGDLAKPSKLRKISLRRLDALLAEHAKRNQPLPPEVLSLAGLQRIEYVFAYPEEHDIVLAGPAEGWAIDDLGNVVGASSGAAVVQLVDLITALRSTDRLLAGEMISCSIEPTVEGVVAFADIARRRDAPSDELLSEIEAAVGPQTIKLTGIAPDSHFAQVLAVADWQMKRLAMGHAPSPVDGLGSYLELLEMHPGAMPRNALPRWWIAFGPDRAERDAAGLAWRLSKPGLEIRTAADGFDADGQLLNHLPPDPLTQEWADAMTAHYDQLSVAEPVFGQLRTCMDLALVTAVLASGDLLSHVGLDAPMLLEEKRLQLAPYPVPQTVASLANAVRQRRAWVITVSGGVELDVAGPLNDATVDPTVAAARTAASPSNGTTWWWD